jgi:hypothetical protein
MKIERFAGHHHEVREALVLSIAGVTAIMLIESLILLILYWLHSSLKQQSRWPMEQTDGFALSPIRTVFLDGMRRAVETGQWSPSVPLSRTPQSDRGRIALASFHSSANLLPSAAACVAPHRRRGPGQRLANDYNIWGIADYQRNQTLSSPEALLVDLILSV